MNRKWVVTLSVKMAVKGAETRSEAIEGALQLVRQLIQADKEVPFTGDARPMRDMVAEDEHLFGKDFGE